MEAADVLALKRAGLSAFLVSDIGTEPNGMTLTLLSCFARRGDDPWREAGLLARMSRPQAVRCLADFLAAVPATVRAFPDLTMIASRLVALLPRDATQ